jgi:chemotaxis protein methyltransferase CheR
MNAFLPRAFDIELQEDDFHFFRRLIFQKVGITIGEGKKDLLQTRLRQRVKEHGLADFEEYRNMLNELPEQDPEWQLFINQVTTNKTDFFREIRHFDFLKATVVPAWLNQKQKTFKAWSAAASSGEEAYTISMVLEGLLPPERTYEILGTDIDTHVLQKAQNAVYRANLLHQIPLGYQGAFNRGSGQIHEWMRIRPHIKEKVSFKQLNLVNAKTYPTAFDVIFCRNVLIYFSPPTIEQVITKLYQSTVPGGYLFIGLSESLQNIKHEWQSVAPSIYRKRL